MSFRKLFLILTITMYALFPCLTKATESPSMVNFVGKIVLLPKEGYGIESDSGNKYLPLDLPELLKQENIWVQVKAEKVKTSMQDPWGEPISLKSIFIDSCLTPEVEDVND